MSAKTLANDHRHVTWEVSCQLKCSSIPLDYWLHIWVHPHSLTTQHFGKFMVAMYILRTARRHFYVPISYCEPGLSYIWRGRGATICATSIRYRSRSIYYSIMNKHKSKLLRHSTKKIWDNDSSTQTFGLQLIGLNDTAGCGLSQSSNELCGTMFRGVLLTPIRSL